MYHLSCVCLDSPLQSISLSHRTAFRSERIEEAIGGVNQLYRNCVSKNITCSSHKLTYNYTTLYAYIVIVVSHQLSIYFRISTSSLPSMHTYRQLTERTSSTRTIGAMCISTASIGTTGEAKQKNKTNDDDVFLTLSESRKRSHRTPLRCMNSCCIIT